MQGCEYQQGIQSRSRAEKEKRGKLGRTLKGLGKGFFFFFPVWEEMTSINFLKVSKNKEEDSGKSIDKIMGSVSRSGSITNSELPWAPSLAAPSPCEMEVLTPSLSPP